MGEVVDRGPEHGTGLLVLTGQARHGDAAAVAPEVGPDETGHAEAVAEEPVLPLLLLPDDSIRVELLPTFVGCPALDAIRSAVEERLADFGRPVEVRFGFSVPWTTDRITERGRRQLTKSGFAPPGDDTCPYCGSENVLIDNLFGPTQCRSVRYCRACRQPFEAFKPI